MRMSRLDSSWLTMQAPFGSHYDSCCWWLEQSPWNRCTDCCHNSTLTQPLHQPLSHEMSTLLLYLIKHSRMCGLLVTHLRPHQCRQQSVGHQCQLCSRLYVKLSGFWWTLRTLSTISRCCRAVWSLSKHRYRAVGRSLQRQLMSVDSSFDALADSSNTTLWPAAFVDAWLQSKQGDVLSSTICIAREVWNIAAVLLATLQDSKLCVFYKTHCVPLQL